MADRGRLVGVEGVSLVWRWVMARWSSFVADPEEERPRILHEIGNPAHRLRVEHDAKTLLIHLSDEGGDGWTVFAVDRTTREYAVAQGRTQQATAVAAYDKLHADR